MRLAGAGFGRSLASNVDFGNDEDIELDLYANYVGKINDTFAITAGGTWYEYPEGHDSDGYPEIYVGMNAGNFSFKQWYSWMYGGGENDEFYTEANYTLPLGEKFLAGLSRRLRLWRCLRGHRDPRLRRAAQLHRRPFLAVRQVHTGTDASGSTKITDDIFNNEPRVLVGAATHVPLGQVSQ